MDVPVTSTLSSTDLTDLLDRVERGEAVRFTRGGKPVATIVPVLDSQRPDVRQVVAEMLAYRDQQKRTLGGITVRELREEGRR